MWMGGHTTQERKRARFEEKEISRKAKELQREAVERGKRQLHADTPGVRHAPVCSRVLT